MHTYIDVDSSTHYFEYIPPILYWLDIAIASDAATIVNILSMVICNDNDMYIHTCVYIYIYVHTHLYFLCIYTYVYMCVCVHTDRQTDWMDGGIAT